jgi:hypothetical protein
VASRRRCDATLSLACKHSRYFGWERFGFKAVVTPACLYARVAARSEAVATLAYKLALRVYVLGSALAALGPGRHCCDSALVIALDAPALALPRQRGLTAAATAGPQRAAAHFVVPHFIFALHYVTLR